MGIQWHGKDSNKYPGVRDLLQAVYDTNEKRMRTAAAFKWLKSADVAEAIGWSALDCSLYINRRIGKKIGAAYCISVEQLREARSIKDEVEEARRAKKNEVHSAVQTEAVGEPDLRMEQ